MGILQARKLEWVSIPFSRGSSQLRDRTQVSCIAGRFCTHWNVGEALSCLTYLWSYLGTVTFHPPLCLSEVSLYPVIASLPLGFWGLTATSVTSTVARSTRMVGLWWGLGSSSSSQAPNHRARERAGGSRGRLGTYVIYRAIHISLWAPLLQVGW